MAKNKTIQTLAEWASDHEKLRRFESVALLCQRTSFVKSLLGLAESDEFVRNAIQRICQRHEVPCNFGRGRGLVDFFDARDLNADGRYMATVLLKMLLASDDSGMESSVDGLISSDLVDRMVYVYRRYLNITRLEVERAPLSFEAFVLVYRAYSVAEIDLMGCENCGAEYLSTRRAHGYQCAICLTHNHAARCKKTPGSKLLLLPEQRVA